MSIYYYPFIGALILVVSLLIRAEFAEKIKQIYIFKPTATVLIIIIAGLSLFTPEPHHLSYNSGILVGLIFSLAGDIALMFKSARAFLFGLVFFLITHIIYSIVFTAHSGFVRMDWVTAIVLLVLAILIYIYLYSGLGEMKLPVMCYVLVISFMMHRALSTFSGTFFNANQAWAIALGAGLFYLSDLILAINKFKRPLKYNRLSLACYFSGQLLIALSTGLF
ncbi:MAG: lysoplasmalogenase [candidate division KSB1 bacterium]|nr:lysoplasmalogenase [candidate division KSB1 bacterium]MDZ7358331.1 lysoplasmalogenase [candidate division KSB1 bacterium]MDZ7399132.1 lysoplasmalogenase [candidate division KSB1 bacterium]